MYNSYCKSALALAVPFEGCSGFTHASRIFWKGQRFNMHSVAGHQQISNVTSAFSRPALTKVLHTSCVLCSSQVVIRSYSSMCCKRLRCSIPLVLRVALNLAGTAVPGAAWHVRPCMWRHECTCYRWATLPELIHFPNEGAVSTRAKIPDFGPRKALAKRPHQLGKRSTDLAHSRVH